MKRAAVIVLTAVVAVGIVLYFVNRPEPPAPPPAPEAATRVDTESGPVVGFTHRSGAHAWLGIPFARQPVGDLRWKAPRPPERRTQAIEAVAHGPLCPQFPSALSGGEPTGNPSDRIVGSEDCLYLNVWAPPEAHDLPVMVWIHGGGNTIGHGGSYIGGNLATAHDLVIVTINYRLGVLGWFSHPALLAGDPLDDSGNYGTLDIVRALEWVQSNIAAFGGDPGNVTVFGESAGAFDTLAMMASPLARGLFHRAIVQSGGFQTTALSRARSFADQGGHPHSAPEIVNLLLVADGTVADAQAARRLQEDWPDAQLRDYLYGKSANEIYSVLDGGGFGMIDVPDNFGDGYVLPDLSTREIFSKAENHNAVPVILGTNRDEPSLFMSRDPRYVDSTLGIFYSLKDETAYKRLVYYGAQSWKARGVDELAQALIESGNRNVYAYRWDWDEEPSVLGYDLSVALGAAHGLEIAFVFGEFEEGLGLEYIYPGDESQHALSRSMMSYWAEFAYTGSPGRGRGGTEVPWLPWGSEGKTMIVLDTADDGGIRMVDDVVTPQTIKAELLAETGFSSKEEHCGVYVRTFRDSDLFDPREYAELGCSDYPPERFAGF